MKNLPSVYCYFIGKILSVFFQHIIVIMGFRDMFQDIIQHTLVYLAQ